MRTDSLCSVLKTGKVRHGAFVSIGLKCGSC